jgi:hypothetical protein
MEPRSTTHAGIRRIAEPGLSAEARPGPPSICLRGWGSSSGSACSGRAPERTGFPAARVGSVTPRRTFR